jgi:hypothetical protein
MKQPPDDTTGSEGIREKTDRAVVARRAYELWEQEGRPTGCAEAHWLEAERQLRGMPAGSGNPANPSLPDREKIVAQNQGKDEPVKKIPADALGRESP